MKKRDGWAGGYVTEIEILRGAGDLVKRKEIASSIKVAVKGCQATEFE